MSNTPLPRSGASTQRPLIGSLLRLPHEAVTARLLAALQAAGHDLSPTELGVFLYPGPEGRRPSDLARQCHMSRQAMNYVLAALERRGYLERSGTAAASGRLVRATAQGHDVFARMRRCVMQIEREWRAHLGAERFEELRATLLHLSRWLGKAD